MGYLIGCLVAALSFGLNQAMIRRIGLTTMISYGPLLEESSKTLPAFLLGADILAVHITFGLVEAGYDWRQNGRTGRKAALFSIAGHSLFGAATLFILTLSSSIWLALAAGIVAHLVWNVTVIRRYA
ncbi:hypothetical protein HSX37_08115|uniref:Uncharacterized protein n=1 Tax=Dendrosporobacter quercicolus TaxID=146817 RepID=A0A1G9UVZ8_9FIRM|nr:hypothetical protein [Dendrosporobacter quercicolus]NSL48007.1 hypothetical protein [Dendrosporobacter quercicolus DSM 1736]SDM64122.1 hypothetical protein SAMN04488502_10686 [Dendrosporobacter quercicolus]